MSHSNLATKNKNQKHPKVQTKQYLYDPSEPIDNWDFRNSRELEAQLLENGYFMKRRIRSNARGIRTLRHLN